MLERGQGNESQLLKVLSNKMIADTTFIIDLLKERRKALDKLELLSRRGKEIKITTITLFELWSGVFQSKNYLDEKKKMLFVLHEIPIISFDKDSATLAGEIDAFLKKKGTRIQAEDGMIAGTALHNHEHLLTRNIKHFSLIPHLKLEEY